MQKEAELAKSENRNFIGRTLSGAFGALSSRPKMENAARTGPPNLEPPAEGGGTATTPGGAGFNIQPANPSPGGGPGGGAAVAPPSGRTDDPGAASGTEASAVPQRVNPKTGEKKDEKKKDEKESSSKKKKGIRKIIPW
jgi:hypothetical protein